jgi:hypothetical protein
MSTATIMRVSFFGKVRQPVTFGTTAIGHQTHVMGFGEFGEALSCGLGPAVKHQVYHAGQLAIERLEHFVPCRLAVAMSGTPAIVVGVAVIREFALNRLAKGGVLIRCLNTQRHLFVEMCGVQFDAESVLAERQEPRH